jgi:hypothetical protein
MALMLGKLYDALLNAGAAPDQAREAAEEVAGCDLRLGRMETRLSVLTWMAGFSLAVQVATLFFIWQILLRLPAP